MNPNAKPPPRDYRREVTDDIIALLEQGTAPWQQPWEAGELAEARLTRPRTSPIAAAMCWA